MISALSRPLGLRAFAALQVRVRVHIVNAVTLGREAGRPNRWIIRQSPSSQNLLDLLEE